LIDALHLPLLDDDDAANDVTNEYEEYYLDGEPESSLVAGLRTGEDPDVHPEEQMTPRQLWFAYSKRYFVVDSVACLQHKNYIDDTIRYKKNKNY